MLYTEAFRDLSFEHVLLSGQDHGISGDKLVIGVPDPVQTRKQVIGERAFRGQLQMLHQSDLKVPVGLAHILDTTRTDGCRLH